MMGHLTSAQRLVVLLHGALIGSLLLIGLWYAGQNLLLAIRSPVSVSPGVLSALTAALASGLATLVGCGVALWARTGRRSFAVAADFVAFVVGGYGLLAVVLSAAFVIPVVLGLALTALIALALAPPPAKSHRGSNRGLVGTALIVAIVTGAVAIPAVALINGG